jgi:hypothetical protein
MTSNKTTGGKLPALVLCVIVLSIVTFVGRSKVNTIKKKMSIGNCYVYKVADGYRGWTDVYYSMDIAGKTFKGSTTLGISLGSDSFFSSRWYPIVYNADDPEQNWILIEPRDFKKFKIPFPDSLDWVKDYTSSLNQ